MNQTQVPGRYFPLSRLPVDYGISISSGRRYIRDTSDPLPHVRLGSGDPKRARILIPRDLFEAWLARRHAALSATTMRNVINEVVQAVRR